MSRYFKPKHTHNEFKRDRKTSFHDNFINKSLFVWGFSMVDPLHETIKNREQKIKCRCPEHGEFLITARGHIESQLSGGCPSCFNEWLSDERRTSSEELSKIKKDIEQVFEILEPFQPRNTTESIKVRCKTCSYETSLHLSNFIHRRDGCKQCSGKQLSKRYAMGRDKFIEKATMIHNNLYEYPEFEYINNSSKIEVVCKKHGSFFVTPVNHLYRRSGCPSCSGEKFYRIYDGSTNLYLIECFNQNERFMKVGISQDLKTRFRQFPYEYNALFVLNGEFKTLIDIEQRLHYSGKFEKYRPIEGFNGGQTECYSIDEKPKLIDHLTDLISLYPSYKYAEQGFVN